MTTALNFPQFAFNKPQLDELYKQGVIGPTNYMNLRQNAFQTVPSQQSTLAQRLMDSMQSQNAQMTSMRNTNMMPLGQYHRLDPRSNVEEVSAGAINIAPLANTNAGQAQSMVQPGASGSGPSFRFQDLNRAFQLDPRNTLASALMQQGMRGGPVRTVGEGIGRLSQSLVGAMLQKRALDRLEGQEATRIEEQNLQSANLANALNTQLAQLPENSPIIPIIQSIQSTSGSGEALNALAEIQTRNLSITPQPIFKNVLDVNGNIIGQAAYNANDEQVGAIQYAPEPKLSALGQQAIDAGFTPGTEEFKNFILEGAKNSGQKINITTGVGGEVGYKELIQRNRSFMEKAIAAQNNSDKVQLMIDFLSDGTVKSGVAAGNINTINKLGQFFNPDFKLEGVAGTDAFVAFTNEIILPLVSQLGRNPTDLDLRFVTDAQVNLGKSVAGNLFLLEALKVRQARDIAAANFVNDFMITEFEKGTPIAQIPFLLDRGLANFINTDPLFTNSYNFLANKFKDITGNEPPKPDIKNKMKQSGLIN
jgi:hypothetical protein